MITFFGVLVIGRSPRKEKDPQGSCQEENHLYAAVRKCYNDWWEAQGEWQDRCCREVDHKRWLEVARFAQEQKDTVWEQGLLERFSNDWCTSR